MRAPVLVIGLAARALACAIAVQSSARAAEPAQRRFELGVGAFAAL
jgi:hypothetical protein